MTHPHSLTSTPPQANQAGGPLVRHAVRTIIHLDLDAFFCAVEERLDPTLRGIPFAVGGRPDGRGVVCSCSYAARAFGVKSAMPMATAIRLCPEIRVLDVRHGAYREASHEVMELLQGHADLLEQISIDEAFLDVTDRVNNGTPAMEMAAAIQTQIRRELDLSCSVGVASNKMVAKIATDYGKESARRGQTPSALFQVPPGEEAAFLAPLPVSALWGVGPKTADRLRTLGMYTIGQVAQWPERDLLRRFGSHGLDLARHARGIDNREVVTGRESKSISSETTFPVDISTWEELRETLEHLSGKVANQLAKESLSGTTIKVKVKWTDFTLTSRQLTLPHATHSAALIRDTAEQLFLFLWKNARPVRLLGVGVSGLSPVRQLNLFEMGGHEPAVPTPQIPEVPAQEKSAPEIPPLDATLEGSAKSSSLRPDSALLEPGEARQYHPVTEPEVQAASEREHRANLAALEDLRARRLAQKRARVSQAINHLETRFGNAVVGTAATLRNRSGREGNSDEAAIAER